MVTAIYTRTNSINMAQKTRADLTSEITALLVDTAAAGSLTPEVIRAKWIDLIDSCFNKATDTNLQGLYPWDATVQYYTGAIVQYDYKWYKANTDPALTGLFVTADWDFQGYVRYSGSLTIATADVLTLNATPKVLVAAIASKKIQVLNASVNMTYNSATYAANTTLQIYQTVGGSPNVSFSLPSFLANGASTHEIATITAAAKLATNEAVYIRVLTGNPTTGNSDITVYFDYIVI